MFPFLGGGSWHGTLITDGDSDREFASRPIVVRPGRSLDVAMRAHGGFVVRLERTEK